MFVLPLRLSREGPLSAFLGPKKGVVEWALVPEVLHGVAAPTRLVRFSYLARVLWLSWPVVVLL